MLAGAGGGGACMLHEIKRRSPDIPVIIMTAYTSVRDAVELVKEGAFDYVSKPFETDDIATAVARALKLSDVVRDNKRLRGELEYSVTSSFRTLITPVPCRTASPLGSRHARVFDLGPSDLYAGLLRGLHYTTFWSTSESISAPV